MTWNSKSLKKIEGMLS